MIFNFDLYLKPYQQIRIDNPHITKMSLVLGVVRNKATLLPIPHATVTLSVNNELFQTQTLIDGSFGIKMEKTTHSQVEMHISHAAMESYSQVEMLPPKVDGDTRTHWVEAFLEEPVIVIDPSDTLVASIVTQHFHNTNFDLSSMAQVPSIHFQVGIVTGIVSLFVCRRCCNRRQSRSVKEQPEPPQLISKEIGMFRALFSDSGKLLYNSTKDETYEMLQSTSNTYIFTDNE